VIKVSGYRLGTAEIESALVSHPSVSEAAVIGIPDEKWGEVGQAFVVRKRQSQISDYELTRFCVEHLAKFKVPKRFEFMSELPKGSSGKILKRELKDRIYKSDKQIQQEGP
jgi:acyl-coenzyme A synthetase/AMP-(fatty) acid ligase